MSINPGNARMNSKFSEANNGTTKYPQGKKKIVARKCVYRASWRVARHASLDAIFKSAMRNREAVGDVP
jgi:hypothetical protein